MSSITDSTNAAAVSLIETIAETKNMAAAADAKLLKKALDFEKEMSAELLKSMGVGQNIDIEV